MERAQWILLGVAITFLTAATVILAISPIEFRSTCTQRRTGPGSPRAGEALVRQSREA
jgi:hypothetical protein